MIIELYIKNTKTNQSEKERCLFFSKNLIAGLFELKELPTISSFYPSPLTDKTTLENKFNQLEKQLFPHRTYYYSEKLNLSQGIKEENLGDGLLTKLKK